MQASFIANPKIPMGKNNLVTPIIPPNISFNFIPTTPDFVYIKNASKKLSTINIIIVKSLSDVCFFLFPVFLFLFAILLPPF